MSVKGKYGWEDLITNPNLEKAKSYVGKDCYFSYTPSSCIKNANNDKTMFQGKLVQVRADMECPFIFISDVGNYMSFPCIIPKEKKVSKPKYVPFNNREEFLQAYEENTSKMKSYGIWVYERIGEYDEDVPRAVVELWGDGVVIGNDDNTTKWKDLVGKFIFENGKPCGKLI